MEAILIIFVFVSMLADRGGFGRQLRRRLGARSDHLSAPTIALQPELQPSFLKPTRRTSLRGGPFYFSMPPVRLLASRRMNDELRFGALCWNQYTDWQSFLEAGGHAERAGYHSLWTWDHLYPIVGSEDGPMFEGYMTLAAWAMATERVRLGLMVGANPYRNPAVVAKMVTALDHISNGRAYLGIGSAWDESEAKAFGIDMGESPGERLRWLREALPVMRAMLHGQEASASGPRYAMDGVRNDPPPVQEHLPIVVGGGGEPTSRCASWRATPTHATSALPMALRCSSASTRL